jgi:hypothetical protein
MLIYSKKIDLFVKELKEIMKRIIVNELNQKVSGNWFLDKKKKAYYPITTVIYNDRSMLGYFDSNVYELGFHERLMYAPKKQVEDLVRHELAHYMTFIEYGNVETSHGPEFRAFCEKVGWGKDVYSASVLLAEDLEETDKTESDIYRKVQKLMALSSSQNPHEAEAAMIKSQQILLKHNIDSRYIDEQEDEKFYLKSVIKQSQRTEKMSAISRILETFFVSAVYARKNDGTHLEILGSKVNVQIADYVAEVLQDKLEELWCQAKEEYRLKGLASKNSFFRGIAKGYVEKINDLKNSYTKEVSNALIVIEGKIEEAKALAYKRLVSSSSRVSHCSKSSSLGEAAGRGLNINPSITRSSKNSNKHISYDS